MTDLPRTGRRSLLAMLTSLPAAMRAGTLLAAPPPTVAAPFSETPRLLVAGPADGALNRWADALLPALEQSLPPDTAIRRIEIGSADGVTGANQFEARGAPDGQTVLLVPGQAALAWLVGDPRAQFDVGHWVPVMAGASPGIVVGRPTVLTPDGRARVAAAGPASFDLAALLGIHLLGARMEPVFGLLEPDAARSAFAQGAVDAVLLRGHRVPEQFTALAAAGAQPLFTLGAFDAGGRAARDPSFPEVPHFAELFAWRTGNKPNDPLFEAWCAAAAAAQLAFGLVLPQLTPAAMVSLWRRAGVDAVAVPGVQATAATVNVRPLTGPTAAANTAVIAVGAPALQELRGWLASRLNWHPG
ncbi:MAG TPA: hypothetical protein VKI44_29850 [Acetobacteraceae bacterium]|nr:hypothetical protein [Acetobacteraceae bacterium]